MTRIPNLTLRDSRTTSASRRGMLGAVTAALLAAGPLTHLASEGDARQRGKRRKHKRRKNRKRRNQQPTSRVDATCAVPDDISFKNESGTARFAQTFTAIADGSLVKAELDLGKDPGSEGDYFLRLSPVDGAGVPGNEVLAEAVVANADVPASFVTVPFTFADPFPVEAGTAYALVLARPGGQMQWDGNSGNPCAGQAFISLDETAPFAEVSIDDSDFIITIVVQS
jgi:hypothetical protein